MQRIEHDLDVFRGGNYQIIWRESPEYYQVELRGITLDGNKYVLGGTSTVLMKKDFDIITDEIKEYTEASLVKCFKGYSEDFIPTICEGD